MRAIFTYHSIDSSESVISVDVATLRAHVRNFATCGARMESLGGLLSGSPDHNAIAVTFDDAFANFATDGWPILRDAGIPVTLFVPADRAGKINDWNGASDFHVPSLPLLDWDAIAQLADEGVAIGSHSRTHPDLRRVDAEKLRDEVRGAADRIAERTGRRPDAFAYPFGLFNEPVLAEVRDTYRYACTTELAVLGRKPDHHRLPRLDAFYYRRPERIGRFGSAGFKSHLWVRGAARRARHTLSALRRTA